MGLTRHARDRRAADVRAALHTARNRRDVVELTLQDGRRRPRVTGRVSFLAASGAFVLLADSDREADESIGERAADPLHVPLTIVRGVAVRGREGFRRVVPNPDPVPDRRSPP